MVDKMIPKIALTYKWEKETLDYLKLPGVTLSFAQTITLDDQIKIIKGGGTITLLAQSVNISKINGLAFLTNPSTDMRKFKGFKLSVKAAGKTLVGWVKAVGTGETLGDELFTNGDCSSDTGWVLGTGWSISGGKLVKGEAVGSYAYGGHQYIAKTAGALYFGSFDVDSIASASTSLVLTGAPLLMMPLSDITGTRTGYATYQSGSYHVGAYISTGSRDIATAQYDNFSLKQVLTPSALGCTIVSTFEGAEQSWTSDDGINPNSLTFDIDITNS